MTYISFMATVDPASKAALEADGQKQLLQEYLLALVSALCVNIYIVGINQIYDVEIDRVNKPYLPLASGEWTIEFAWSLCGALLAGGLGLGYAYGTTALQLTLGVSAVLGTAYSVDLPGMRWKKHPILAAGCILSVRSVIVQVGFFSHIQETLPSPVPWQDCDAITFSVAFILAFSIVIAFFKDLPDIAGDEAAGVQTLAVRFIVQMTSFVLNMTGFYTKQWMSLQQTGADRRRVDLLQLRSCAGAQLRRRGDLLRHGEGQLALRGGARGVGHGAGQCLG